MEAGFVNPSTVGRVSEYAVLPQHPKRPFDFPFRASKAPGRTIKAPVSKNTALDGQPGGTGGGVRFRLGVATVLGSGFPGFLGLGQCLWAKCFCDY